MTDYLINEISKENFKISDVYKGSDIFIEEKYGTYTITTENISNIFECEEILRKYYGVQNEE